MSKKLEKLREVNSTINTIISELETYIFIEKIGDEDKRKTISSNRLKSRTRAEIN